MLINPFLNLEGLLFHMHLKGLYLSILMYSFGGFCFIIVFYMGSAEWKQSITELYAGTGVLSVLQSKTFFYYCVLVAFWPLLCIVWFRIINKKTVVFLKWVPLGSFFKRHVGGCKTFWELFETRLNMHQVFESVLTLKWCWNVLLVKTKSSFSYKEV